MKVISAFPSIKNIDFVNDDQMIIHLDNERAFLVPLDTFPSIKKLKREEKEDFEVIDGTNLSFLVLDEVFSLEDLIGIH